MLLCPYCYYPFINKKLNADCLETYYLLLTTYYLLLFFLTPDKIKKPFFSDYLIIHANFSQLVTGISRF